MSILPHVALAVIAALGFALPAAAQDNPPNRPDPRLPEPQAVRPVERPVDNRLMEDFRSARTTYLRQQNDLRRQLRLASEAQREALRERLRQVRADQNRKREQLRQRLQELRAQLPDHRELIDQARDQGREEAREKAKERQRRGE